jgi:hyperosmotically inducible protein
MAATVLGALVAATAVAVPAQTTKDKVENRMDQAKDKIENGMEQTRDKVKSTTEKARTAVSDSWITSKTKIALFADERVKGTKVSVDTKGGVVHLRGKVDSQEAKDAAAEVARGIEGAKSVKNDLQIVSPGIRKAVDANDKTIAKAVEGRMTRDAQLKKVEVRADGGVVTLTGEVPTLTAAAKASEQARMVSGVRSVKSELTVRSASK